MKKKVKLFSTIASLCLAVALMAFGVWAANTAADFHTASSVTFTAETGVYGDYKAEVKTKAGAAAAVSEQTITATRAYDATDWSVSEGTDKAVLMNASGNGAALTSQEVSAVGDQVIYEYSFTNNSPYSLTYTFTEAHGAAIGCDAATKCSTDAITVSVVYANDGATEGVTNTGTVEAGKTVKATVTITLNCRHISADAKVTNSMNLNVVKPEA